MALWKLDPEAPAAVWLRAAAERRALPHALLFTGGDGPAAAEFAAAAMECTADHGRPCGVCRACRKVLSGIHPDVITVQDPEHKLLSAETVRNVRSDAYIRPNEGERKVYVFPDCALLTEADQNILLKTVEEGPPSAAFLFCAGSAAAVLPTLRSRCVECKLHPEETEETPPSPRAEAFLRALAKGKRGETAAACVRLEREKLTGDDLEAFCAESRELLIRALKARYGAPEAGELPLLLAKTLTNDRLTRTIELLETFRRDCRFHIAPAQALGALAAEAEELL
ncbi:MAG: DNA polymerase III subunit delta' [Dysosmobacter sp.]|nr:DNA polymerase III subunit delta' [Dysosmobacter sp.]